MMTIATSKVRAADPFYLPQRVRKQARALLDQQLWNFGCDARNVTGNIMLAFGFNRDRPAAQGMGSTAYTLSGGEDQMHLVIWGFGAFAGDRHEGVFLRRFRFSPALATSARPLMHVHFPQAIRARSLTAGFQCEARRRQLYALLETFARYETWVQSRHGAEYRESCLRERAPRARRHSVPPSEVATAWHEIALHFAESAVG